VSYDVCPLICNVTSCLSYYLFLERVEAKEEIKGEPKEKKKKVEDQPAKAPKKR
jgi:hypothetical protein